MNEYRIQLLDYISKNYDSVVKQAIGGEYIETDLIPNGHDGSHDLSEILEYCESNEIDVYMFTRSYPMGIGDGIRMGRYMYYMQKTTKQILEDLKNFNAEQNKNLSEIREFENIDGSYKLPEPPLSKVIREGIGHFCSNCGSTTPRSGFLMMFGKRYCDNHKCSNSKPQ